MEEDFVSVAEEYAVSSSYDGKAKVFAKHPGKPVTFGGSQKRATKGRGSIRVFVLQYEKFTSKEVKKLYLKICQYRHVPMAG
ncbi:hypothetical protein ROHU_005964 [Labeo rohita]|uniref:Uncharacterized protein n=1 Tax=Labeo rohita TaxID=84645 RepID=A0A498N3J8_LABRO|nr:hypothetical protein ROHU_005964 [Labeo rohita]